MPPPSSTTADVIPDRSSFTPITLDEVQSPALRLGAEYWRKLRGERRFPAREDLNPREIAGILTRMNLVKVIDGGADYEFRIVGDAQAQAYNVKLHKRRVSEIAAEAPRLAETKRMLFSKVVNTGAPFAMRTRAGYDVTEVNFSEAEAVFLPLGASDAAVDHLLIFSDYVWRGR